MSLHHNTKPTTKICYIIMKTIIQVEDQNDTIITSDQNNNPCTPSNS